ncbi:MAG: hypothetical protein WKF96_06630 [Solirubrobacteraceae bacterium]
MAARHPDRVRQGREPVQGHLPRRALPPPRASPRRQDEKAIIAIAHEILTATWHMLSTGELYREQGPQVITERDAENARRRAVRQLERLGHKVTLQPLAEAA